MTRDSALIAVASTAATFSIPDEVLHLGLKVLLALFTSVVSGYVLDKVKEFRGDRRK